MQNNWGPWCSRTRERTSADTILRFAKEYRVGHIVLGSPGKVPFLEKTVGEKSVVERLIKNPEGITVVVLDTSSQKTPTHKAEAGLPESKKTSVVEPSVSAGSLSLSGLLSSRRIITWDTPVEKDLVLKALVEVADKDVEACDSDEILQAVRKREEQGSTFFNEGVAFPHARIEGISTPVVALGLTRQGVLGESAGKPIELVFLILSPAHIPAVQVQVLALVSRAARNRQLVESLSSVRNPEEALTVIRNWEMLQEPGVNSA